MAAVGLRVAHAAPATSSAGLRSDGIGLVGVLGPRRWPPGAREGDVVEVRASALDPLAAQALADARAQGARDVRLAGLCLGQPVVGDAARLRSGLGDAWRAWPEVALLAVPALPLLCDAAEVAAEVAEALGGRGRLVAVDPPEGAPEAQAAWARRVGDALRDPAGVVVPGPWAGPARPASGALLGLIAATERASADGVGRPLAGVPVVLPGAQPPVLGAGRLTAVVDGGLSPLEVRRGEPLRFATVRTLARGGPGRDPVARRILDRVRARVAADGAWLVFEHLRPELYALAARTARSALERLRLEGLLEGTHAEEAYRVVCDPDAQPHGGRDAGRIVVDVRVRPRASVHAVDIQLVLESDG